MADTCFICKQTNDTKEQICSQCAAKGWVQNPVGLDLTNGKALTVRHPASWWLRAEDLIVAAQALIEDWRTARTAYFGGLPYAKGSGIGAERPENSCPPMAQSNLQSALCTEPLVRKGVCLTPLQHDAYGKLRVIAVAEMLIGMAFECAAKAIIIGADSSIVDDKLRWNALTRGHNLADYINKTPIGKTLTPAEKSLLARLKEAIEWRGRYPGSKRKPDQHMQASSEQEFEGWQDLWRKLHEYRPYAPLESSSMEAAEAGAIASPKPGED